MEHTDTQVVCEIFNDNNYEFVIAVPSGDTGNTMEVGLRFDGSRVKNSDELERKLVAFKVFCSNESNHTVLFEYDKESIRYGMASVYINDFSRAFTKEAIRRILDEFADIIKEMYEEDALD